MALTKISGSILKDPLNLGEVSIGGTLTYQDVTNVDALGVGTFRAGINVSGGQLDVGSNIKLGNAGVVTATRFVGNGDRMSGIHTVATNPAVTPSNSLLAIGNAGSYRFIQSHGGQELRINSAGNDVILPATRAYVGSNPVANITNNADNRVITGGSNGVINGEANLTWNGTLLNLTGTGSEINLRGPGVTTHEIVANSSDNHWEFINNSGAGNITSDVIFKGSGAGGGTVREHLRIEGNSVKISNLPSGYLAGALRINTDYTNFGHIIVRDKNNANACAIMAENENSGSDEYNRIYRSVNRNSQAWANATLCAKSHTFRISNDGSAGNKFVIKNDGNVEITDGNLIMANGHGIDFSATANSTGSMGNELLNDYEEGSWSPTYTVQSGNAGSVSYSAQQGYYVKIGHTVWVMIDMTISSASGMSGNACIGGFPFQNNTRQGQGYYYSGTMNWYIENHSEGKPIFTGWMVGNSSLFRMHNGNNWGQVPNAPLNTTGRLSFSLWYTTNS